jgi:transcriptional regulator with XRE-family HTH domain
MTQEQAAAAVGVDGKHISAAELGERGLSYKTILALTRTYKATLRSHAPRPSPRDRTHVAPANSCIKGREGRLLTKHEASLLPRVNCPDDGALGRTPDDCRG